MKISCLPHPCHLFGLSFFWNSSLLLVCIHIELGSHLKQVTTVLFSSSRAGSSIFKTANIGRLTFLLPFSRQKIHEKSTKNGEYQCTVTPSCTGQKLMKYKFNLYFTFEINNIHNRSCRKLFFLPLLNPLFHYSNLQKVFNWSCTSQNIMLAPKLVFPSK